MSQIIEFTVLGDPVAQARPRAVRTAKGVRMYDTGKVKDAKSFFKMCAAEHAPEVLIDGPMFVTLDVYVQKPKSWKKNRTLAATAPDVDNYAKLCLDSMQGVLYTNDSRIVTLIVSKRLSDKPRCEVRIEGLVDGETG